VTAGAERPAPRSPAVALALAAALGWATYYLFVLWGSPGTAPSAILAYPFLVGGVAFAALATIRGDGRAFVRIWASPAAYLRTGLMLAMQISILAATYLVGPVDASLLSLLGDVVVTPVLVAAWLGGDGAMLRRPRFVAGLLLSLAGGTLAIVGGRQLTTVHGWGWLTVGAVPLSVAFYFILSARANESAPPTAVVGQSMLGAAIGAILVAPWIPGGWPGLVRATPPLATLLVLNGVVSFFVAPTLYFAAIRRAGIVVPAMLMTAIPIFTLLLSVGVLGLSLPWLGAVGIPVAVVGALLVLGTAGGPAVERAPPAPR